MSNNGTVISWPFSQPNPALRLLDRATPHHQVGSRFLTEVVTAQDMPALRDVWTDLAMRALDPNVFLEPAFALPAIQHFYARQRPSFVLVWEEDVGSSRGKLIGLLPFFMPWGLDRVARATVHEHAALGTPLLAADQAREAIDMMIGWFGEHCPNVEGLMLSRVPKGGSFYELLRDAADGKRRELHLFNEHERAVLSAANEQDGTFRAYASPKKLKELRRLRRRLGDFGAVTYQTAREPADIRQATEAFLVLEEKGWKGRRKTALLSRPTLTTFTRTMTRLMALEGKCRIDTLAVAGVPVAMGIVLESRDRAHFWKTAYDEKFAALSPGVQLTLALTQTQLADHDVAMTDSCAIADHPMINWVWPNRMTMADILVPTKAASSAGLGLKSAIWMETGMRGLRQAAKTTYNTALNRK